MNEVEVYCPDCRGRFEVDIDDIREEEILECSLCGCELEVLQENPLKLRIVSDDY